MSKALSKLFYIKATVADLYDKPNPDSVIGGKESQLLLGEGFIADKLQGNYLRGRSVNDDYPGYIHESLVTADAYERNHVCVALSSHIYMRPDFKCRPSKEVSFMSRLTIPPSAFAGEFLKVAGQGWIPAAHVAPLSALKNVDHVDTAMLFLGLPYRYGGRTSRGLDCSALVQLSFMRKGINVPRDAADQEKSSLLGATITPSHTIFPKNLQRGDIVFFPGHVGIMVDPHNILNATQKGMMVKVEPVEEVALRSGDIRMVRRPNP